MHRLSDLSSMCICTHYAILTQKAPHQKVPYACRSNFPKISHVLEDMCDRIEAQGPTTPYNMQAGPCTRLHTPHVPQCNLSAS